jgi:hypothetical protein
MKSCLEFDDDQKLPDDFNLFNMVPLTMAPGRNEQDIVSTFLLLLLFLIRLGTNIRRLSKPVKMRLEYGSPFLM